jgi:hypothetical protein
MKPPAPNRHRVAISLRLPVLAERLEEREEAIAQRAGGREMPQR